jgi:hypothetical protein
VNGERKRDFIDAGDARPLGVLFYYLLSDTADDVSIAILDADGNEVRTYSDEELPHEQFDRMEVREYSVIAAGEEPRATVSKGLNRFIWDMRYPSVSVISGVPPVLIRPFAKPGTYQVRLTVNGESQVQSFELKANPNESYSRAETDAKSEFWMELHAKAEEGVQAVLAAKAAQEKVGVAVEANGASDELKAQGVVIDQLCGEFVASMVATGTTLVQIISEPTRPLSKLVTLHNIMETSEGPPNQPLRDVYARSAAGMDESMAAFHSALAREMAQFDSLLSN